MGGPLQSLYLHIAFIIFFMSYTAVVSDLDFKDITQYVWRINNHFATRAKVFRWFGDQTILYMGSYFPPCNLSVIKNVVLPVKDRAFGEGHDECNTVLPQMDRNCFSILSLKKIHFYGFRSAD